MATEINVKVWVDAPITHDNATSLAADFAQLVARGTIGPAAVAVAEVVTVPDVNRDEVVAAAEAPAPKPKAAPRKRAPKD